jgi:hypothetical protein
MTSDINSRPIAWRTVLSRCHRMWNVSMRLNVRLCKGPGVCNVEENPRDSYILSLLVCVSFFWRHIRIRLFIFEDLIPMILRSRSGLLVPDSLSSTLPRYSSTGRDHFYRLIVQSDAIVGGSSTFRHWIFVIGHDTFRPMILDAEAKLDRLPAVTLAAGSATSSA